MVRIMFPRWRVGGMDGYQLLEVFPELWGAIAVGSVFPKKAFNEKKSRFSSPAGTSTNDQFPTSSNVPFQIEIRFRLFGPSSFNFIHGPFWMCHYQRFSGRDCNASLKSQV